MHVYTLIGMQKRHHAHTHTHMHTLKGAQRTVQNAVQSIDKRNKPEWEKSKKMKCKIEKVLPTRVPVSQKSAPDVAKGCQMKRGDTHRV